MQIEDLLDPNQASNYLKVSITTVYRLLRSKQLPACKIGRAWRLSKSSLDSWIQKRSEDNTKGEESCEQ